jgi:hypothetical protein
MSHWFFTVIRAAYQSSGDENQSAVCHCHSLSNVRAGRKTCNESANGSEVVQLHSQVTYDDATGQAGGPGVYDLRGPSPYQFD